MKAGERAGAVSHTQDETLYLFGFGTYVGDKRPSECPQKPGGMIGNILTRADSCNPLIKLDDGNYVWGCECWFGPEEQVRERFPRYDAVETISIVERRTEISAE